VKFQRRHPSAAESAHSAREVPASSVAPPGATATGAHTGSGAPAPGGGGSAASPRGHAPAPSDARTAATTPAAVPTNSVAPSGEVKGAAPTTRPPRGSAHSCAPEEALSANSRGAAAEASMQATNTAPEPGISSGEA
jgi:hypothetical protein